MDLRRAIRTDTVDLEATTVETPMKTSHLVKEDVVPDLDDEQTEVPETALLLTTVAAVISSPKKKVTFDLNVTEYDPPSPFYDDDDDEDDPTSSSVDTTDDNRHFFFDGGDDEEEEGKEDGEIVNPTAAYPLNHRYQDCTDDADFEDDYYDEDLDLIDGVDDEEDEEGGEDEESYESYFSLPIYRAEEKDSNSVVLKDLNSIPPTTNLHQQPKKPQPTTLKLRRDKENLSAPKVEVEEEEVSVDTSLSSWLTPPKNKSTIQTFNNKEHSVYSSPSFSHSPAMQSPEERPILGALTVEDIKHSPISTKKMSPRKSPDVEMPIFGTVGSYWKCSGTDGVNDGGTTFTAAVKGIPNTTSKYREVRMPIVDYFNFGMC